MATTADAELLEQEPSPANPGFFQTPLGRNFALGASIAAVLAIMVGVWLWSQQPNYKVLFANFSDRDGGAIVASLQQLNVPYKYAEGGSAILVPAEQVHDVRLKLASQGLPKGGNVGFELMENQKLGISQFLEQVNFQRALEGELARSIQSLAAVQSARVHLALPKPSVFVRDQQKPTASVLLNLHPGRSLDQPQVSAIVHLVASSVPELLASNVTVVDQNGSLVSDMNKNAKNLDPNQLKYVQQLQMNIAKQVESIVLPIVGPNNVRAEATADVDFSQIEQAAETYKPNSPPAASAIRSQQTSEQNQANGTAPGGVPGALSNQPPTPGTAPITTATTATGTPTATGALTGTTANGNTRKDSTTNFEVDKTIRYTQQAMGGLRRLSVAVIVNFKRSVDAKGKVTITPLTAAEKQQITDLVKDAMGFSKDRGDTLSVLNTPFDGVDKPDPVPVPIPWWKDRENWEMAKEAGKILITFLVLAYLYFKILLPLLRPAFRKLDEWANPPVPEEEEEEEVEELTPERIEEQSALAEMEAKLHQGYRENLQMAKNMAKEDPRIVANVVKAWVGTNE